MLFRSHPQRPYVLCMRRRALLQSRGASTLISSSGRNPDKIAHRQCQNVAWKDPAAPHHGQPLCKSIKQIRQLMRSPAEWTSMVTGPNEDKKRDVWMERCARTKPEREDVKKLVDALERVVELRRRVINA